MPKTNFSDKCAVLGILYAFYRDTEDETWKKFFEWGDLGMPLSYMIHINAAKPTPEGKEYVEDCWRVFCEMVDIDPNGEYHSLGEALKASPNPPIEA